MMSAVDAVDAVDLARHLRAHYGVDVVDVSRLDSGVFRVARSDGPDWIARVFAAPREAGDVEADAAILRSLEQAGFPAERCATGNPVSVLRDTTVLVTGHIAGTRADGRGRTCAILGALLGRLHARPAPELRPGGAWHHLSPRGTPADEIRSAISLLGQFRTRIAARDRSRFEQLRALVDSADPCLDLPHAFVHPDFVPANAITTPDDRTVIIDWTNSDRGPRLWSIGFLLWAAGARDLRLVDAVVTRYRRHTQLGSDELDRLPGAIRARALMLDCWSISQGRAKLGDVEERARRDIALSEQIADQARRRFAEPLQ